MLTTGDLLQASTQVQAVFIDGKPLEPTSKQTRLYDRYKERSAKFRKADRRWAPSERFDCGRLSNSPISN